MKKLIALLVASILPTQGALTFGGATSDRVNIGSATSLDNMTAITVLCWVYPTTLTDDRIIVSKYRGASAEGWQFGLVGTSGDLKFYWERAVTDLNYFTTSTPLATNSWRFIAAAINQTGPSANIYSGTLATESAAATLSGSSVAGSGAFNSDAARSAMIGNRDATTPNVPFQGRIATVMIVNREMSAGEIKAWQFRPRIVSGTVGLYHLNGTGTQADWSGNGNAGTVTGASQADHVPLGPYFGFDWRHETLKFLGFYNA